MICEAFLLPIPGTSRVRHVEENVAGAIHIEADTWAEIEVALQGC